MLLLMAYWRKWWCRWILFAWLAYEIAYTVITLGSRGRMVLLLLSAGVLYHRLVKPMRWRQLIVAGTILLTGFLILCAVRVVTSKEAMRERAGNTLTGANEFQGLFTTAYDLHERRRAGKI